MRETDADPALDSDLVLLREAAGAAGALAMGHFGRDTKMWMKDGDSPVSAADLAVDAFLRETLLAARPDYGWLSEETVDDKARLAARRTFVVDPIDGTRAFLDGRSTWCVSVAVVEDGRPLAGVLDCPALGEVFEARHDGPALCNGAPIAVRAGAVPVIAGPKAMIAMLPEDVAHRPYARYVPSLAYRLAMVARGNIDATFVKADSHDWDLAAADLILRRAGGSVIMPDGRMPQYARSDPRRGVLAAGSGALLEVLAGVLAAIEG